ncbi:cation/calcium exchanger 5-like [Pyrus ussuriensis x Pyrus communis]|uniref:Cation/calcium exchanger 5-like n=1 Tax=Pyrus ussuriensis x Pyrus communis TaxID=2448454 RepID=A0A5N5HTS0_9ROSA|nr:cation/calcium exchanger 5-like [Pyrus ussuriensis x Pyrus communis]
MPLRQVVLALAAPRAFPPPHLQTTTTKMSGRREKSKEAVLDQCAPLPQLQTTPTTDRAGTREKTEEVALALSPHNAPPQPLNITTTDGTKSDYSVRPKPPPSNPACHGQKRKQEKGAAASALQRPEKKKPRLEVVHVRFLDPDATESSSDDVITPPVTNGRKRKEVEIVHEIKILEENPNTKRRKTQETITKTRRKIKKDQKTEEELVGEKIVIKKQIGSSSSCLKRFFDGIPEDCEDIPPEVKIYVGGLSR